MSIQRLTKYVNLALNNSSEGEARNAASRFFKTLKSLDMRFNSKQWGLSKADSLRLAELGGVKLKGVEPTKEASVKPVSKAGQHGNVNVKATCYKAFGAIDMDNSVKRRAAINWLVENFNFDKRSVQSYASNYRKENSFQ
jgi:hypothetical protein